VQVDAIFRFKIFEFSSIQICGLKAKYWRNNLVELGPSISGFLDKFVSFPRLVCQTKVLNPPLRKGKIPSITRESNPAPLG
jgi:hypothetical protein